MIEQRQKVRYVKPVASMDTESVQFCDSIYSIISVIPGKFSITPKTSRAAVVMCAAGESRELIVEFLSNAGYHHCRCNVDGESGLIFSK